MKNSGNIIDGNNDPYLNRNISHNPIPDEDILKKQTTNSNIITKSTTT